MLEASLGRLLGDYMMALEHYLPAVTELDLPRLANAVGARSRPRSPPRQSGSPSRGGGSSAAGRP